MRGVVRRKAGLRFSFPKPVGLLEYLVGMVGSKDCTILDFYAGSGTTAEAIMRRNKADNGSRRFIMVSSTERTESDPDKNLCRDVCAPRIRLIPGADFAYLRTHLIPFEDLSYDLEPSHIWLAVQALHGLTLRPFDAAKSIQIVEDDQGAIAYFRRFSEQVVAALRAVPSSKGLVVYAHAPGTIRAALSDRESIEFRTVPDDLIRRFQS